MIKKHKISVAILCILLLSTNNNLLGNDSTPSPTAIGQQQCQLNILLTNDDGWQAPGIQSLFKSLQQSGHNVTIVAPLTQQSGRSSAINTAVGKSVSIKQQADNIWSVDGTPADSVKAALGIVFADQAPQLVVSGANFGPNIGQQTVLNSGTLGASLTAHHAGIPVIAMSVGLDMTERNKKPAYKSTIAAFDYAANLLNSMLTALITQNGCDSILSPHPASPNSNNILSINVPVPAKKIKGIVYAPLSANELFQLTWYTDKNKVNKITYSQVDKSAALQNDDVGYFLRKYITVTPLSGDLTSDALNTNAFKQTTNNNSANWLPKLSDFKINN